MRTFIIAILAGLTGIASLAYAQTTTTANQGSPGNQGAWPVRFVSPTFPGDGGTSTSYSTVSVYPYPCATTSPNKVTYQDGGVQNVPTTAASNRLYTIVCNSKDNSTGNLRCRADGTAPTTTVGSIGDVLAVGDCIPYTNPSGFPVKCIGSNLYVTSFECVR